METATKILKYLKTIQWATVGLDWILRKQGVGMEALPVALAYNA
jgi:hypothetical protein